MEAEEEEEEEEEESVVSRRSAEKPKTCLYVVRGGDATTRNGTERNDALVSVNFCRCRKLSKYSTFRNPVTVARVMSVTLKYVCSAAVNVMGRPPSRIPPPPGSAGSFSSFSRSISMPSLDTAIDVRSDLPSANTSYRTVNLCGHSASVSGVSDSRRMILSVSRECTCAPEKGGLLVRRNRSSKGPAGRGETSRVDRAHLPGGVAREPVLPERPEIAELGEAYRDSASYRLGRLEHGLRRGEREASSSAFDRSRRGGKRARREGSTDRSRASKSLRNGVHHANAVVWEPVTPPPPPPPPPGRVSGRVSARSRQ